MLRLKGSSVAVENEEAVAMGVFDVWTKLTKADEDITNLRAKAMVRILITLVLAKASLNQYDSSNPLQ